MDLTNLPLIGWILKELATLRAMVENLHAHHGLPAPAAAEPRPAGAAQPLAEPSAKVEAVAPAAAAPAQPATPALDPATQIKTPWGVKNYTDFPTYAAFAQLEILDGGNITDDQIAAWMKATGNGDPRKHSASGAEIQSIGAAPSETGFDFGPVPSGKPLSNDLEAGVVNRFTFTVASPTKMRLTIASELSMGKPVFDNFSLVVKSASGELIEQLSQAANSGASFIEPKDVFQPGAYTMELTVDKRDRVVAQWNVGA